MENRDKFILGFVLLVLVVAGCWVAAKALTNYTGKVIYSGEVDIETLARALNESGARMYGAYWCGHCQNQKSLFELNGTDLLVKYGVYVECDPRGENSHTDVCLAKNIQGYPTWEINGKTYEGEQSLETLAKLVIKS